MTKVTVALCILAALFISTEATTFNGTIAGGTTGFSHKVWKFCVPEKGTHVEFDFHFRNSDYPSGNHVLLFEDSQYKVAFDENDQPLYDCTKTENWKQSGTVDFSRFLINFGGQRVFWMSFFEPECWHVVTTNCGEGGLFNEKDTTFQLEARLDRQDVLMTNDFEGPAVCTMCKSIVNGALHAMESLALPIDEACLRICSYFSGPYEEMCQGWVMNALTDLKEKIEQGMDGESACREMKWC